MENPERAVPIDVSGRILGVVVIYIVSNDMIAGIVSNMDLAHSTVMFGVAFAQMFTPMMMALMSCCGSLLGWQFIIAQVFKSSARKGYFPKIFSRVTKADAPVQEDAGHCRM